MLVLRARCQRLVGTLGHHVRDALAVVAFLWLGGQATLLGMVIQTSTVITAAAGGRGRGERQDACDENTETLSTLFLCFRKQKSPFETILPAKHCNNLQA